MLQGAFYKNQKVANQYWHICLKAEKGRQEPVPGELLVPMVEKNAYIFFI